MNIQSDLQKLADKKRAKLLQGYFKTGKGEYGDGDVFIGLTVPQMRFIAKKYKTISLKKIEILLHSKIHEYRLTALIILTYQFEKTLQKDSGQAGKKEQEKIVDLYLHNTKYINNWDLVDLSAHEILGLYLLDKPRDILYKLVKSKNIWERRIAVISTFAFLRNNELIDSLKLADILLDDPHDLMHKAVGWMLREIGKRDEHVLVDFLAKHYKKMPRTMLRYAIEKLDEKRRRAYLASKM